MDNKMILVIPQFHNVTRSFSQKIQIKQFEPIDFFSSHNEAIPMEEATPEKIKEVSERLYQLAKQEVHDSIVQYKSELDSANGVLSTKDLDGIAKFIADINSADSQEAIDKVRAEIVKAKATLNKAQVDYLRSCVAKVEAKL